MVELGLKASNNRVSFQECFSPITKIWINVLYRINVLYTIFTGNVGIGNRPFLRS